VLRTLAEVNGYAYAKTDDAILVNLYGGSALATRLGNDAGQGDANVRLAQSTEYPWDGDVRLDFQETPGREFALNLRIPGWADSHAVRVNGEELPLAAEPGTFITLRRTWRAGDQVALHLPMPVVELEANPLVEEARNQVAFKRGPIVYCLESHDLPPGTRLADITVPAARGLAPRHDPSLLAGLTVLEGEFVAEGSHDWNDELYRPRQAAEHKPISARLIPYYAWANRGTSEMTVWLPLAR
jgi:DUF1680 family protein